jgi:hypothetical protein
MSCAIPGSLKMLELANTRGAIAPVSGVQDSARIGKQGDRYWSIDMFLERRSIGPVSRRTRYFELKRPLRGEFALVSDLPISCNSQH